MIEYFPPIIPHQSSPPLPCPLSAMASSDLILSFFKILVVLSISSNLKLTVACFTSIVSFGDSLTDTGNFLLSLNGQPNPVGRFPFGETYFHHPTGRFSDGRIILDFIAEAMGLPHVPPFLGGLKGEDFSKGVNFAIGGATAVESSFFWDRGIELDTNFSLGSQIQWFKQLLPSLCPNDFSDCEKFLENSLFFVGEIGGNDYNIPLMMGRELDEIKTYVPRVIHAISSAIHDLIDLGAKTLVVPGYLPVGCLSGFLTVYHSSIKEDHDPHTGCIKSVNEFAKYHDRKLLNELHRLRQLHPSTTIVYADYYGATMRIFDNPHHFGFGDKYLSACCGGGGPYNYNKSAECGTENASVCSDPSRFVCWDGKHMTESAYKVVADALIHGPFPVPQIKQACHVEPQQLITSE